MYTFKSGDFAIISGLLFYTTGSKCKRTKDLKQYQIVVPDILKKCVISYYHDSPLASHSGIKDTYDRLRDSYYFHGMAEAVANYVKSCHDCQSRKVTQRHTKAGIVSLPMPSAPFEVWEIDLYGPLPKTPSGKCYIFTAVDMYSKYIFVKPLANKDALTVSTALVDLFAQFGVCNTIVSIKGRNLLLKLPKKCVDYYKFRSRLLPVFPIIVLELLKGHTVPWLRR